MKQRSTRNGRPCAPWRRSGRIILTLGVLGLALALPVGAGAQIRLAQSLAPDGYPVLPALPGWSAVTTAGSTIQLPTVLTPAELGHVAKPARGLDSRLDQLRRTYLSGGLRAVRSFASTGSLTLKGSSACVVIVAAPGQVDEVMTSARACGCDIHSSYGNLVLAWVPVSQLATLARAKGVLTVRSPAAPSLDDVTSEGVHEVNADAWQAAGISGAGVKVGIIDGGFSGYTSYLGSELPVASKVIAWGGGSGGPENSGVNHGTAVAEIVHEVAPGATLYLAKAPTEVDIGNAKDWMLANGVKIINMSMGWSTWGPGDGTGVVDSIVTSAVSQGVFWANSAGNDRLGHWRGNFVDSDNDGVLNWDGSSSSSSVVNTFVAPQGWDITGALRWKDSWTAASQDYDLSLYYLSGSVPQLVGASVNYQTGQVGQTPVEEILATAPATGLYGWVITRYSATRSDVEFDFHTNVQLDDPSNLYPHFFDHDHSLTQPADNASLGFMAAAAVSRAPGFAQENYSSEGPTEDGRLAPEIAAPDDTSSVVLGGLFPGTSASSPHLAGVAALVKAANPSFTPAQIETYLRSSAIDLGPAGPDSIYGYGRLLLPAPPLPVIPAPTITAFTPTSGLAGSSVTLTGTGFTGATAVSFNGHTAIFTVNSDNQITATVPSGATSGAITVTTTAGTASSSASFTVLVKPPTITAFTPTSGLVGGSVTLTGTNFTGATAVAFSGHLATSFTVRSATQIITRVPSGATSGAITVTTPGGKATSTARFTVLITPTLTLKLSGLTKGVVKLGKTLTASGKVTPTNLGGKVTLTVQREQSGHWYAVTSVLRSLTTTGAYSWTYKPTTRATYRLKAAISATATHMAVTTVWLAFTVK